MSARSDVLTLLQQLHVDEWLTVKQLARRTGYNQSTVHAELLGLLHKSEVERRSSDGIWEYRVPLYVRSDAE